MKNLITITIVSVLFILCSYTCKAQEWCQPVLISTMQGYNDNPDIIV
ncbi:MAG: hypothetical protein GXO79_01625 [Chlorobi bacterium]|nr:hypothetical protein [Chlorobiota bacterium]